ncbi:hypothetical protein [Tabrizicola sp.]|uniref:COG3904 family protein n=1 Tax=Tabrizicola sp. TaxID=2005166 RepID=UPI003D299D3E
MNISDATAKDRMTVDGHTLIFDTSAISSDDESNAILRSDANLFGDLIMNNPSVDTVIVSGDGGSLYASYEIARTIMTFDLNVVARGDCESGCAIVFLGGKTRTLEKGARLGFHRSSTEADNHKKHYELRKDKAGWKDEFAYARWTYEDGQIVARDFIAYLIQRGVAVDFALRTLIPSGDDMWYPSIEELAKAGVLTEPE